MDTFRTLNELATIYASAGRALDHLGNPPQAPTDGNKREQLHARAALAIAVAKDRTDQARRAVEELERMGVA